MKFNFYIIMSDETLRRMPALFILKYLYIIKLYSSLKKPGVCTISQTNTGRSHIFLCMHENRFKFL